MASRGPRHGSIKRNNPLGKRGAFGVSDPLNWKNPAGLSRASFGFSLQACAPPFYSGTESKNASIAARPTIGGSQRNEWQ